MIISSETFYKQGGLIKNIVMDNYSLTSAVYRCGVAWNSTKVLRENRCGMGIGLSQFKFSLDTVGVDAGLVRREELIKGWKIRYVSHHDAQRKNWMMARTDTISRSKLKGQRQEIITSLLLHWTFSLRWFPSDPSKSLPKQLDRIIILTKCVAQEVVDVDRQWSGGCETS
jgi:hypothetical protein